ncbi:hypothetical protein C2845_PM12G18210 [Panicum miliaceum]|uniref:Uncharacterized protein n=1 Tax=Panicum miliaceum TaxID=4540 RepID=A0A3L6QC08_PANMI|nr:hypothetical protein C2845_PM12G18210 [Panicum miliaceum]
MDMGIIQLGSTLHAFFLCLVISVKLHQVTNEINSTIDVKRVTREHRKRNKEQLYTIRDPRQRAEQSRRGSSSTTGQVSTADDAAALGCTFFLSPNSPPPLPPPEEAAFSADPEPRRLLSSSSSAATMRRSFSFYAFLSTYASTKSPTTIMDAIAAEQLLISRTLLPLQSTEPGTDGGLPSVFCCCCSAEVEAARSSSRLRARREVRDERALRRVPAPL